MSSPPFPRSYGPAPTARSSDNAGPSRHRCTSDTVPPTQKRSDDQPHAPCFALRDSWRSYLNASSDPGNPSRVNYPESVLDLSQVLFGAQGQLDHPLEQLFRRQTSEVAHNELLGIQPDQIAQLERLAARGEDEVPMPIVNEDQVAVR